MNSDDMLKVDLTGWLEKVQVRPDLMESAQLKSEHADVPISDDFLTNWLTIPSLLTRARLSAATRRREERRLADQMKHKKKLAGYKGKRAAKGRYHYESKARTKKARTRRAYEKGAGLNAILGGLRYRRKAIDPAAWERLIAPLFREYPPEYLTVKMYYRVPPAIAGHYGERYGRGDWPYTVYTLNVEHKLLGIVYNGREQEAADKAAGLI